MRASPISTYPRLLKKSLHLKDHIKISLTAGKWAILDKGKEHLCKYNWCFQGGYAVRYIYAREKRWAVYLHHAIIGRPLNGMVVDHINHNSLDNRIQNLRIVTIKENCQNRKDRRILSPSPKLKEGG